MGRGLFMLLAACALSALARPGAAASTYYVRSRSASVMLYGPGRHPLLGLSPRLVLKTKGAVCRRRFRLVPPASAAAGFPLALRAEAQCPVAHYRLHWTTAPGSPGLLVLQVRRTFRLAVEVISETLEFGYGEGTAASYVSDSYRLRRAIARTFVGGLGTQLVTLEVPRGGGRLQWRSESGVQGLWLDPRRQTLTLELDHRANHPLRVFPRCVTSLSTLFPPTRRLDESPRAPGSEQLAEGVLVAGYGALPLVERLPSGYAAALVLTDHADQSSVAKLEAFAFGSTGALAKGARGSTFPGFVNRGLRYTKSVFLRPSRGYAPQFSSPRFRALLDELQRAGVEIGVHSVSGGPDGSDQVRAALVAFRRQYAGRTWIDHQPYTNCEAIASLGWDPRSRWYVLPQLAATGFRYLWAVPDIKTFGLDLLRGDGSGTRRPVIYPHPRLAAGGVSFWLFRTVWLFERWQAFVSAFSRTALDRLVRRSGLFIGHVYLDTHRRRGPFRGRSLLQEVATGRYRLRAQVDRVFQRLARRQVVGQLWVSSLAALLEHLQRIAALRLRPSAGSWKLGSARVVRQLTLRVVAEAAGTSRMAPARGLLPAMAGARGERRYVISSVGPSARLGATAADTGLVQERVRILWGSR